MTTNTTPVTSVLLGLLAVAVVSACTISGLDIPGDDGGTTTTGAPDTSVCEGYCRNVMECAAGWGGGAQKYVSQSECAFECAQYIEGGGGCGEAASAYFECAAAIDDCQEYSTLHEARCADLEDSFAGWCL